MTGTALSEGQAVALARAFKALADAVRPIRDEIDRRVRDLVQQLVPEQG